jgi:hypothetical protein
MVKGKSKQMKTSIIISSFRAAADNCVAVAFIKAMLAGKRLYTIRNKRDKTYLILKDGSIFTFTPQQLKALNSGNGIRYHRSSNSKHLRQQVEVLFALLVLQLQLHGYHGKELTASKAKKILIKGIETHSIHRWLGVQQRRGRLLATKPPRTPVLLFNTKHIAFASNGYFDNDGTAIRLPEAHTIFLFGPPTHYYKIF